MHDIDVTAFSAIALNIKVLAAGGTIASHLSGVPQFAFCDFVTEEADTVKRQRTLQNKLLPGLPGCMALVSCRYETGPNQPVEGFS